MREKILIVDDDDTVRTILHRALTEAGYRCFLAGDISGGMGLCAREMPDLVLLDVNLPDGNGLEACRRIKADEALRQASVMIVTGMQTEFEHRIAGVEAGADDYIVKPFRIDELVARVEDVLAHRPKAPPAS